MNFKKLISELKRRNVFKVATAYVIAGWLIIQVISTIAPQLHLPGWVPTFFTILVLTGFPIAIILAWAFEMTPEGVKRTDEVPKEQSITRATGKKLNYALITVLALAVVVLSYKVFFGEQTPAATNKQVEQQSSDSLSAPSKSIAVLPFENLSTDSANAYFADGMQDLILTKLADIGQMKVISRTSTEQYGSHPQNLKKIGRELGVATLLEGSVQKAGDQVLINVQLINARTDNHLWAESYTRTLHNIFGVEGEVAQKIAQALHSKLTPLETDAVTRVPTTNAQAYQLYLKALQKWDDFFNGKPKSGRTAINYLQEAVKHDPRFAEAYAKLADYQAVLVLNSVANQSQLLPKALKNIQKAQALQPDLLMVHQALAVIYADEGKTAQAAQELKDAVRLAPNNVVIQQILANRDAVNGQWDQAARHIEQARRLNPRSGGVYVWSAIIDRGQRKYREALQMLKTGLIVSPHNVFLQVDLGSILFDMGKPHEAITSLTQLPESTSFKNLNLADLQYRLGAYRKSLDAAQHMFPPIQYTGMGLKEFYIGRAELALGQSGTGHHDLQQAEDMAKAALKDHSKSGALYITMAFAEAYLGQHDKALKDIDRAILLWKNNITKNLDAMGGAFIEDKAEILAHFKDAKDATALLDTLMQRPGGGLVISPARLRIDKTWNPIRNTPVFQKLLAKYPEEEQP